MNQKGIKKFSLSTYLLLSLPFFISDEVSYLAG